MKQVAELLFDVVLYPFEQKTLIQLSQMLDGHMLQEAVGYVVLLQLVLSCCEHPFNRIEHRGVLWDGEGQELPLLEELLDAVLLMDARIVK